MSTASPVVSGALAPLFPDGRFAAAAVERRVAISGPATWWAGPLDVEDLLRSSIRLALAAAAEVGAARGRPVDLSSSAELVAANAGSYLHLLIDGRPLTPFADLSGFFETADGWVRLHGNYPHHALALERELGIHDRAGLVAALRELRASDVEARVRAAGGVAGAVRSRGRWRATAMGVAADAVPWIDLTRYAAVGPPGVAARPLAPGPDLPLDGIRVLDLTRVIAGPTGSRLLALLGADVLRVDPPHPPELLDQYLDTGAGKRSAEVDLRDPMSQNRIHELLEAADILLMGYRPGALAAYDLGPEALAERHPHLVHVSLSAWGVDGPWGGDRGFDSIVQACTGIGETYAREDPDGRIVPGALPVQALDVATGYGVAAAALGLLARRPGRGGGGARLSLARTAHALIDAPAPAGELVDLPVPTAHTTSPHGVLRHVIAPVRLAGAPLPLAAPGGYGAADLAWR